MLLEVRGVDAHMGAPLEICSKRSVVAVLASGVVISLTALTGGIAPAFAKPDTDQVVTTTVSAPEPKVQAPEDTEAPSQEAPPKAPATLPVAPSVEAPPQTQQAVEPPPPPVTQSTTAPVVTPVAPASPTTTASPTVTKVESPAPRVVAPPVSETPSVTSTATSQSPATQASSASSSPARNQRFPASVGRLGATVRGAGRAELGNGRRAAAEHGAPSTPSSGSATPGSEPKASEPKVSAAQGSSAVTTTGGPTVSVSQAAKVIETVGTADPAGAQGRCRARQERETR